MRHKQKTTIWIEAAAVSEFHVIYGPNTLDARNNIELFAFHTFLVEVHQNEAK